jgi:hypothetical protein
MKKNVLNVFGFNVVKVNNMEIYTCKVCVKNNDFNVRTLNEHGISYNFSSANKIVINFGTVYQNEFNNFKLKLGKCLKEIALNNLEQKYSWVEYNQIKLL